jgi:hypothetical protein
MQESSTSKPRKFSSRTLAHLDVQLLKKIMDFDFDEQTRIRKHTLIELTNLNPEFAHAVLFEFNAFLAALDQELEYESVIESDPAFAEDTDPDIALSRQSQSHHLTAYHALLNQHSDLSYDPTRAALIEMSFHWQHERKQRFQAIHRIQRNLYAVMFGVPAKELDAAMFKRAEAMTMVDLYSQVNLVTPHTWRQIELQLRESYQHILEVVSKKY